MCRIPEPSPFHPFRSPRARRAFLDHYDARASAWPTAAETRTVETPHGRTFARICGPENAPPMVLLHGIGGNALQWMPNIAALSQDHRTYAVDAAWDFGRSVPTRPPTTPEGLIDWLHRLLDALGLHRGVRLVGLSYGGWAAATYAARFPERLHGAVLIAPPGLLRPSLPWMVRAALCMVPHRRTVAGFFNQMMADLAATPKGRAALEPHIEEALLALRSFRPRPIVHPRILTDRELRRIAPFTFLMVGENEKLYPPRRAVARIRRAAPRLRTAVVPGAGHDLTFVRPEMVGRMIRQFLEHRTDGGNAHDP